MAATMTATARPAVQRSLDSLKSGRFAALQRFRETDPIHADCFGDESFRYRTSFGTIVGWRVLGKLGDTGRKILDVLSKLITEERADLIRRRPKNDHSMFSTPSYSLECFLIGIDTAHASPHITVVTKVEWFSKCLRETIIKSNILLGHKGWKCFRLPFNVTPTSPAAHYSMGLEMGYHQASQQQGRFEIYIPGTKIPPYVSGTEVEIWNNEVYIGTTTLGGMILMGDHSYALTVAHAFLPHQPPSPDTYEIDESELGFLEVDEGNDMFDNIYLEDETLSDTTVSWPMASIEREHASEPQSKATASSSITDTHSILFSNGRRMLIGYLAFISHTWETPNHEVPKASPLDWALVEVTHPGISTLNPLVLDDAATKSIASAQDVRLVTPSGTVDACVISRSIFGLPVSLPPQPALVINSGSVQHGDSGSWAYSTPTQEPRGMLIGTCSSLCVSYILDIEDVLTDIEHQTGRVTQITTSEESNNLAQHFLRYVDENKGVGIDGDGNEAYYIALPKLREYWSSRHVLATLTARQGQMISTPDFLSQYIRTFSILVYINEWEHFEWFLNQDMVDSQLPLRKGFASDPHNILSLFEENQWMFCPLQFDSAQLESTDHVVHTRTILPITIQETFTNPGEDEDATFVRVRINEDCNTSFPNDTVMFKTYNFPQAFKRELDEMAVSNYKAGSEDIASSQSLWLNEIEVFRVLRQRGESRNIARCYGSFRHGQKGIIILENADGGTLLDLFYHTNPPLEAVHLMSFFENMMELVKGLERIYTLPEVRHGWSKCHCAHLDLKPSNILIFQGTPRRGYTFKIGDFGLRNSRHWNPILRSDNRRMQKLLDEGVETVEDFEDFEAGRRYDIWSLASMLLQAVSWTLHQRLPSWDSSWTRNSLARLNGLELTALATRLKEAQGQGKVHHAINNFILKNMISQTPKGPRDVYRTFHNEVLPAAEDDYIYTDRSDTMGDKLQRISLQDDSITWETQSQRSSASLGASAAGGRWDQDSAFYSGTASSGSTSMATSISRHSIPALRSFQKRFFPANSDNPPSTVDAIDEWLREVGQLDWDIKRSMFSNVSSKRTTTPSTSLSTDNSDDPHDFDDDDEEEEVSRLGEQNTPTNLSLPQNMSQLRDQLSVLKDRDQVFLVDNSASMKPHWDLVLKTARVLSRLGREMDLHDMDLFFTSDPIIGYHNESPHSLENIIRSQPATGISRIRASLDVLFDRVITNNIGVARKPGEPQISSRRPVSLIVLTNGVWETPWESRESSFAGVDHAIERLCQALYRHGRDEQVFSIQFIRFGNDGVAHQRLSQLGTMLRRRRNDKRNNDYLQHSMDVVNTTPYDGDVWEMLIGGVMRSRMQ